MDCVQKLWRKDVQASPTVHIWPSSKAASNHPKGFRLAAKKMEGIAEAGILKGTIQPARENPTMEEVLNVLGLMSSPVRIGQYEDL